MIQGMDFQVLRNAEFLQFHKDVAGMVFRNYPATLNVQQKYDALVAKLEEVEALFKKVMGSDITAELMAIDERRDNAIIGISQLVLAYTYHYDEGLRQHAGLLQDNLKLYGNSIARMNYQAETTTITALINDWNTKQPLADAITALGLSPWTLELAAANNLFNTRYLDRTQEISAADPASLNVKRAEVNETYYALRDRINALHTLADTTPSPYTSVITQVNTLIDQYSHLVRSRGNHTASPEGPSTDAG